MGLISPKRKRIVLAPVRPNLGIAAAYRRKLDSLIVEMQADVAREIEAAWRRKPPAMAADASPAMELRRITRRLSRTWQRRFDDAAPELADYFAKAAHERADGALENILKRSGFSVRFKMTAEANDLLQATIAENVGLIRSIAFEHLSEVEGMVMRSVQTGRDLKQLSDDLAARYQITRRRAELIARDQNNKATAMINRARQRELGITQAIWIHSGGGRKPRESHVRFAKGKDGGPIYDVDKGALIDGEYIHPGEKINCRCVSRSVIPGLG